ncbi:MAG: hypothetical protein K0R98_1924 [Rickettsiaceae bacterium]|jgi:ankyrin repeat protein|nr:hypothetical protein [Rickettsiaceae bacterium]
MARGKLDQAIKNEDGGYLIPDASGKLVEFTEISLEQDEMLEIKDIADAIKKEKKFEDIQQKLDNLAKKLDANYARLYPGNTPDGTFSVGKRLLTVLLSTPIQIGKHEGTTLLHYCAHESGFSVSGERHKYMAKVAEELLNKHADPLVKNPKGRTAREEAIHISDKHVVYSGNWQNKPLIGTIHRNDVRRRNGQGHEKGDVKKPSELDKATQKSLDQKFINNVIKILNDPTKVAPDLVETFTEVQAKDQEDYKHKKSSNPTKEHHVRHFVNLLQDKMFEVTLPDGTPYKGTISHIAVDPACYGSTANYKKKAETLVDKLTALEIVPNKPTDTGVLPLHIAASNPDAPVTLVQKVAAAYPKANFVQDNAGNIPAHYAAANSQKSTNAANLYKTLVDDSRAVQQSLSPVKDEKGQVRSIDVIFNKANITHDQLAQNPRVLTLPASPAPTIPLGTKPYVAASSGVNPPLPSVTSTARRASTGGADRTVLLEKDDSSSSSSAKPSVSNIPATRAASFQPAASHADAAQVSRAAGAGRGRTVADDAESSFDSEIAVSGGGSSSS